MGGSYIPMRHRFDLIYRTRMLSFLISLSGMIRYASGMEFSATFSYRSLYDI